MGEKKVFSTRINADLVKKLKHLAVDEGRSLGDLIEDAISEFIKKKEKQKT